MVGGGFWARPVVCRACENVSVVFGHSLQLGYVFGAVGVEPRRPVTEEQWGNGWDSEVHVFTGVSRIKKLQNPVKRPPPPPTFYLNDAALVEKLTTLTA